MLSISEVCITGTTTSTFNTVSAEIARNIATAQHAVYSTAIVFLDDEGSLLDPIYENNACIGFEHSPIDEDHGDY